MALDEYFSIYGLLSFFLRSEFFCVFENLCCGITTGISFCSDSRKTKHSVTAITWVNRENRKGLKHLLHIGYLCSAISQQHSLPQTSTAYGFLLLGCTLHIPLYHSRVRETGQDIISSSLIFVTATKKRYSIEVVLDLITS